MGQEHTLESAVDVIETLANEARHLCLVIVEKQKLLDDIACQMKEMDGIARRKAVAHIDMPVEGDVVTDDQGVRYRVVDSIYANVYGRGRWNNFPGRLVDPKAYDIKACGDTEPCPPTVGTYIENPMQVRGIRLTKTGALAHKEPVYLYGKLTKEVK